MRGEHLGAYGDDFSDHEVDDLMLSREESLREMR